MIDTQQFQDLKNLDPKMLRLLKIIRWKARTDLGFLCREILGYPDVSDELHAPILNILQKFPKPDFEQFEENDKLLNGRWVYKPILPNMTELPGRRRKLILDPRSFLKTTINAQSGSIQWLLNYPDIAIFIVQSNVEKAQLILSEIKKHFQYNPVFRAVFPEYCPKKNVADWGTLSEFTVEARGRHIVKREKSLMTGSIDKSTAGLHFEVMVFSDIVEPNNSVTDEQCYKVEKSFYMMQELLVSLNHWLFVEGTRYHYADLYGKTIQQQMAMLPEDRNWDIHVRGVWKKEVPPGYVQKFSVNELEFDDLLDANGHQISLWPERFPTKLLKIQEAQDPYLFSCQKANCPRMDVSRDLFPISRKDGYPATVPRQLFDANVRIAYREISIDTAETITKRSDFTAIVVASWSTNNVCFIEEIVHGKFLTSDLVLKILELCKKYRPLVVKIEETGYVRGLKPSFERAAYESKIYIPFKFIKRDNKMAKQERIEKSLQPWYKAKFLRFVLDLDAEGNIRNIPWELMLEEFKTFPLGEHDDILDALSDLYQGKNMSGRLGPRPLTAAYMTDQMLERHFNPGKWEIFKELKPEDVPYLYQKTGGL